MTSNNIGPKSEIGHVAGNTKV